MIWLPALPHYRIHPALRDWLTHPASLTAKLREAFPDLRVRVLRQTQARPNPDECALLGIAPHTQAWVREVVLHANDTPLVFAHSVLPAHNVRGAWNLFAGLGARPLGEVLFTDPGISRAPLAFRAIDARHPLHKMASAACPEPTLPATLWARRSLFKRTGRSLLVSEVFLPALIEAL